MANSVFKETRSKRAFAPHSRILYVSAFQFAKHIFRLYIWKPGRQQGFSCTQLSLPRGAARRRLPVGFSHSVASLIERGKRTASVLFLFKDLAPSPQALWPQLSTAVSLGLCVSGGLGRGLAPGHEPGGVQKGGATEESPHGGSRDGARLWQGSLQDYGRVLSGGERRRR